VWDLIHVRDGASVQSSIISAGSSTVVLLVHEMEGGRPWTLGASGCAFLQYGFELAFGHCQAVRIKTAWAAVYRWAGRCTYVMFGAVAHLAVAPCWLC
jgi:hypothetical protein